MAELSPTETTEVHQRKRRRTSDAPHPPLDGSVVHAEQRLSQRPIPQVTLQNNPLNKVAPMAKRRRGERSQLPRIGEPSEVRRVPIPAKYEASENTRQIIFAANGVHGISVLEAISKPPNGQPAPELPLDGKEDKVFTLSGTRGHLQIFVSHDSLHS